jgi:cytochrome c553
MLSLWIRCIVIAAAIGVTLGHASEPPIARDPSRPSADPGYRTLIASCANCHGPQGVSHGAMPSLAGLDRAYLDARLRGLRAGDGDATLMHQLAKAYTDREIEVLADYYAQQATARPR